MKATGKIVRPKDFPEMQHIHPGKLALVPYQQHAEEEKEVGAVGGL